MSDVVRLGYAGACVLSVCLLSGLVLTGQALFGVRTWTWLRYLHLISTLLGAAGVVPHFAIAFWRRRKTKIARAVLGWASVSVAATIVGGSIVWAATTAYSGTKYQNGFPADYSFA